MSTPVYLQFLPLTLGLPKLQTEIKEKKAIQKAQEAEKQAQIKQSICEEEVKTVKEQKLLKWLNDTFVQPVLKLKRYLDTLKPGGYHKIIFIITLLAYLCVATIVLVSFFLILQLQYDIYRKKGDELYETRKIPYKQALEYQAVQSLELFSRYPYQAIYIVSVIGLLLVFLRYLFVKQQSFDDYGKSSGDSDSMESEKSDPLLKSSTIFYICIYCFIVTFATIQLSYRKKVAPIKSKVDDFNDYVRSLLPANFDFLKTVSTPPILRINNEDIPKKLAGITPNVRDLSRSICVVNLYNYYVSHYTDGSSELTSVLSCFDPVNRLILTQGGCFSDYLIRNETYIDNKVISILRSIEALEGDNDVKTFIKNRNNRLEILTSVDAIMNKLNEKSNCLDSTSAFMHFTRMAWMIFFLTWIPLGLYVMFLYWLRDSKC